MKFAIMPPLVLEEKIISRNESAKIHVGSTARQRQMLNELQTIRSDIYDAANFEPN